MTDELEERLQAYRMLLAQCRGSACESVFQKVADQFEDDLLEAETFPESYFEFVLELLTDSRYHSKPGVWNFLLVLSTEQGKLEPRHYRELSRRIEGAYLSYVDRDLCLAACDFVARNYPPSRAREILGQLAQLETQKSPALQGYVREGMRIVDAEEKRAAQKHH